MLKNTYVNKLINNLSIIDRIKFSCNEVIEKVILRYLDGYGNEKLQEFSINQIQNIVTIDFNKTLVQELTIEILGAQAIADIELNTYPIEKFSINEDIERKILLNTLSLTSSPAETTKPIERAFDGDLNSDAQLKKYSTYAWIHMSLDEERLIDKFNILSYRAATSGLIKKFRILVKNPMDQSWVEAGNYTVDEFKNEWLTIKTTPYLTKEVTLIVEDSENKWAYINEIELYNYSTLERDILNLFTDETLTDIRFNVSYKEIMNLKARIVNTQYFNNLLDKALEIYLSREIPGTFRLTFDDLKVVDNITFRTYGDMEAYNVSYINSANEWVKISTPILENNQNKTLDIPKILAKEIYVEIYGVSDPIDIKYKEYPLSDFALIEDTERKIPKESIEILTINENSKFPLTNMLDGNERTESHMSGTYSGHHDYNFKFDTLKMVDKFKILSTRFNPNFTSGSIKRFELFNKDLSSNELVSLGTYFVKEYNDNWRELNFEPALTNELILRVYESDRNWICINEVEIYQHSLLEKAIKNLFLNNELNSLKEHVTYWDILNLKKQVQNTKEYMELLNIAEDLYYEDKFPVTLELKFDTLKVIDDIQFKVNGIMEKNYIGYVNTQNENIKLVAPLIQNGENVTIDSSKFLTKKIYIQLYGVTEIKDLTFSEYPFEEYAIINDAEKKLPKEMIEVFTKNENPKFPLINIFDGNEKSESHMSSTFSGHHDYNFKFNSMRIVDKFRILSTRFNPNFTSGSIKRFELLGKDLSSDKLILLGEYVVEEYNDNWRELDFTPILTDELILRIYESDRNWVCINEVEILHFSTLEARIEYLFTDKWCTSLRSDVTFEEIKELSDLVTITQEYRDLINRAFELFYDGVPPKSIEIEFDDLKVFSAIEFDIVGKLEKVLLSYYDTYHNLQEKDCSVQIIDDKGIITLEGYAYTKAVKIEAYAAKDIKNIKFTEHAIEEFVLIEDLEQRISYDEVIVSCNNVNESYPLSNMFDGNVKTDFRSRGFNEFLDINIKLKKASIIDEIGLTSFRFDSPNGVTGLIKKATILIKDTVSKNWLEFGKLQIDEFITNMHILKNIPYLTDEICIRILEADRSWALINELSINKYSLLEAEIKSLFTDETYTLLKDSVTYKLIKALKERVVSSEDLKELVSKALELYFENKTPILEVIPVNNEVIFDRIDLEVVGEIERIVFEYKDAFKNRIQKTFDYIEQVEDKFSLNLPKLNGNNALIKIYGVSSVLSLTANTYPLKDFSVYNDVETYIKREKMLEIEGNQVSNSYSLERAFDENLDTDYRSKGFTDYTDVNIKLMKETLLEQVKLFSFRSLDPGMIKGYSVFVKNTLSKEWINFGEYNSSDFMNDWTNVKNVEYLTDEIKIRVTNAEGNWAYIKEIQLCPLNALRYDIDKLFKDETFMELREGVTLEEILNLESLVKKDSTLIKKLQLAKFLFETLTFEEIEIPLNEIKIFDRIEFITEGEISKIHLKYIDTLGYEREKEVIFNINGDNVIVEFEKIMTSKAALIIYGKDQTYGIQKIYQIKTNSYNFEEFSIDNDTDKRLQRESFSLRNSALNAPYNKIENIFDGDLTGQIHFKTTPGAYIYLKLDKPMLIEAGRVMSYRKNSTSGFLQKYKISLKNNFDGSWVDLGSYQREEYENDWLEIKGEKYLTDEIWINLEQGENNWMFINELEIFIYNLLEEKINNLFKTSECLELKDTVTGEEISELLSKDLYTQEYIDKLVLAKKLYIEKISSPIEYEVKNNEILIANGLEIYFEELPDKILDTSVYYKDSFGNQKYIKDLKLSLDLENKKAIGTFGEKVLVNPQIQISLDEDEKWKVKFGQLKIINQNGLFNNEDISNIYPSELITLETTCAEKVGLENILDGNNETYYQSSELGEVTFRFQDKKIFNSLSILSEISGETIGRVYNATVFYRGENQENWEKLKEYENNSPTSLFQIDFPFILAKEIRIVFRKTINSQIIISNAEFNIYNRLHENIGKLFKDKEMFTELNSNVTKEFVQRLKSKLSSEISEVSTQLKIAENIIDNNGEMNYDIFRLNPLEKEVGHYYSILNIKYTTGRVYPTPYYIYPNIDQIIISNRDLRLELCLADHKPLSEHTFYIKKGINIVNLGDKTGHVFINGGNTGDRKEEIKLYTTDKVTGLHYKYGYTTEDEFYSKERNLTYPELDHVSSNTAYVEGKNFTAALRYDWIRENIPNGKLTTKVEALDEFLDFLYYIAEVDTYFENAIPYKRLMWEGGNANPHAGVSFGGAYTAYANNPLAILDRELANYAKSWVVGHEVGHELDYGDYSMGLFGEVFNNWFAEEARLKYLNNPRCAGNMINITDTEMSIYEMGFFEKLAFWIKLRLYYNDGDFFVKYHNMMRNLPTEFEIFEIPDRLSIISSMIIGRDTSDYFMRHKFPLTQPAIEICNQYPKFSIDITKINWENQFEFRTEEKKRIYEIYKENV